MKRIETLMKTLGITALVPPELVFACGFKPLDVNNMVPASTLKPHNKLCAWTATWRDHLNSGNIDLDAFVVVAGGDCHNALVDGQYVSKNIQTFYFFYPFDGDAKYIQEQMEALTSFLGGIENTGVIEDVISAKKQLLKIDQLRCSGKIAPDTAFEYLISGSDLQGNPGVFNRQLQDAIKTGGYSCDSSHRVALLGVPPIYADFHKQAQQLGLHIAFDELPFEFIRHTGQDIRELAQSYAGYTFARDLKYRFGFLEGELKKRRIDGIIHYTQFACHHILEDEMLREGFDYPILTVQGDLPGNTPEQLKLRLEAFSEMLWRKP